MDVERIVDDIEQLQQMFEAPDIRPFSVSDVSAAIEGTTICLPIAVGFGSGRYGVRGRAESPAIRLGERES
jgi:hypothetical protein